jgi:hypothetical protein
MVVHVARPPRTFVSFGAGDRAKAILCLQADWLADIDADRYRQMRAADLGL